LQLLKTTKSRLNRRRFWKTAAKILDTHPIHVREKNGVEIVSMVRHPHVEMYLLAIKSFYRYIPGGSITVIADPTLTDEEISTLKEHVVGINIVPVNEIDTTGFPSGGTWERLIYIVNQSKTGYVMQLDADTLTTEPPVEVLRSIADNTAYLIGDPNWMEHLQCSDMAHIAKQWHYKHIQSNAESIFGELDLLEDKYYLRGCSAFCGFPQGGPDIKFLLEFSTAMEKKLGKRWSEWGTEQLSSNIVVANSPGARVLPWPQYSNYLYPPAPGGLNQSAVVHFIGSNRFLTDDYQRLALNFINEIK